MVLKRENIRASVAAEVRAESTARQSGSSGDDQWLSDAASTKEQKNSATVEQAPVAAAATSVETQAEASLPAPEVIVAKAENSLLASFAGGMRSVFNSAARAYESFTNLGTIEGDDGERIEVGARASVLDAKRGVADFFVDLRASLVGGTDKKPVDVLEQDEATEGWKEKTVEATVKYPGFIQALISRLPNATETVKRAFLAVAVEVPRDIYKARQRHHALEASLKEAPDQEREDESALDTWLDRTAADNDQPTVKPLDLLEAYHLIADSLSTNLEHAAKAVQSQGREASEIAITAATKLKEGINSLQTRASEVIADYKANTRTARAQRDAITRTAAVERLIDRCQTKITPTDRDRLLAGRVINLKKQISELQAAIAQGESHKTRLLSALEKIQANDQAREALLANIQQALAAEEADLAQNADLAKNKARLHDLQGLLNAYLERASPTKPSAAETDSQAT